MHWNRRSLSVIFSALVLAVLAVFLVGQLRACGQENDDLKILQSTSRATATLAKKATPAVVFVSVQRTVTATEISPFGESPFNDDPFNRFFGGPAPRSTQPRRFRQMSEGSGFIISKDGQILTNNHVVQNAERISVKLRDGREFDAKLIGTDPLTEVAVIKIEANDLPVLTLGNSDEIEPGEWVMAIGNPFGLSETVTVGVVSAKGRSAVGIADYEDFLQTDAAVNPGNSGGPLINMKGEVIGMNTAIATQSGGSLGIGFAIPSNMIRTIMNQLLKQGKVIRGYLGIVIQDLTPDLAKAFGRKKSGGILIAQVEKDSPAVKAGLKQGDIIVELNGKAVTNTAPFRNEVAQIAPGTDVKLKVIRENQETEVTVTVGTRPSTATTTPAAPEGTPNTGLEVQDLTPELAHRLGYPVGEGVLVAQVAQDSPAQRVGIQPGDLILSVDQKKVTTVAEYQAAMGNVKAKQILLLVKQKDGARFVILKLD